MGVVAVGIIYVLLETVLELLLSGTFWIAERMLTGLSVFSADSNLFEVFVNLIPGAEQIHLMTIIKGFAYGLLTLLFIVSILKAIASPLSGESADDPVKTLFRMIVTALLIPILFGFDFGTDGMKFNGVLSLVGVLFSSVLASFGDISELTVFGGTVAGILDGFDVAGYLAMCVLLAAIMVTVIGAAITHIQRCVSLGLSVILGPIFVVMNASSATKDTFRQWALSIFTQFLAIFVSMFMWIAFAEQMKEAMDSAAFVSGGMGIWNLAVALVILNIMKNSEKILNSFGLRTIDNGDSARALIAGAGTITGAIMMGSTMQRNFRMHESSEATRAALSGNATGTQSIYNAAGNIGGASLLTGADGGISMNQLRGFVHSAHPVQYARNANTQRHGVEALRGELASARMDENQAVRASSVNDAFGWSEGGKLNAVGDNEGNMKYTSFETENGSGVSGVMGDVVYSSNGNSKTLSDAFIVTEGANNVLAPGTSVGTGHDGSERIIDPNAYGPIIDGNGNQLYATVPAERGGGEIPEGAGANITESEDATEIKTYPAQNIEYSEDDFG